MANTMNNQFKIIITILLALTLSACDTPKLNKLSNQDVIVAFGDSLTMGVGTEEEFSYPSVLAELSGIEVINEGISGETTSEGLERLPDVLDKYNPSLLILIEGGNDILRNKDYNQIKNNLDQMIQLTLARGTQVVLIGVPEKRLFSNTAPFYEALAEKYDLVFDDSLIGGLMRSPSKKSDPIHFNQEGYYSMAEGILDILSDNGAVGR